MNNSNNSMKDSSESNKKITIDKLINQTSEILESAERITIDKLTNQSSFEVNHVANLRIIPRPDARRIEAPSYKQVLLKNIEKNKR